MTLATRRPLSDLDNSLADIRGRIAGACRGAGRPEGAVRIVAVSKKVSAVRMAEAVAAGQQEFGESYVQEALPKIASLPRDGLVWHFIGPVQSNKTAELAIHFDWVHGLDREKIARRLSERRPDDLPPLNVCVQVNISGETTKAGIHPSEAGGLCRTIAALPRLRLRGLMAVPAPAGDGDAAAPYRALRNLYEELRSSGLQLDTLSAGMSDDFEAAIAEGSTLVRIGTALFGQRP